MLAVICVAVCPQRWIMEELRPTFQLLFFLQNSNSLQLINWSCFLLSLYVSLTTCDNIYHIKMSSFMNYSQISRSLLCLRLCCVCCCCVFFFRRQDEKSWNSPSLCAVDIVNDSRKTLWYLILMVDFLRLKWIIIVQIHRCCCCVCYLRWWRWEGQREEITWKYIKKSAWLCNFSKTFLYKPPPHLLFSREFKSSACPFHIYSKSDSSSAYCLRTHRNHNHCRHVQQKSHQQNEWAGGKRKNEEQKKMIEY